MQKELEVYLHQYNHEHIHQDRGIEGRIPHQVFLEGLEKAKEQIKKEMKKAA